jgi:hypothetical protein
MIVAIVNDNVVTEVKTVSEEEYSYLKCQLAIDVTTQNPQPQVGWTFNGTELVGVATSMIITRLAMRSRFTVTELMAVYTASQSNVFFKVLLDNLSVATFIDLSRPDTIQGMNSLWQYGVISKERINEILTKKPTAEEAYKGN